MFAEAVGMIAIAALALAVLSASAGSRVTQSNTSAAAPAPGVDERVSAAGGYTLAGAVHGIGGDAQTSAAGRWRMQGRFVAGRPGDQTTISDSPGSARDAAKPAADITGDGITDFNDALAILQQWGACAAPVDVVIAKTETTNSCSGDVDGNGHIDGCDLALIIADW